MNTSTIVSRIGIAWIVLLFAPAGIQAQDDFVRLSDLDTTFRYDMRYATENNFLKQRVYDCADCVIRREVAEALIKANDFFKARGYRITIFDCYRPVSVQRKMWQVLPNPTYVANPVRGSVHNRGAAVDITLVDEAGNPLEMGTDFDHFGKEAHHSFQELPESTLENRRLLKAGMEANGFAHLKSEWWHYNFATTRVYEVSDFTVECANEK